MKSSSSSEEREIDLITSKKSPAMLGEESGVSEGKLKKALGKLILWTSKNVAGD
jgi:hypothetical protein